MIWTYGADKYFWNSDAGYRISASGTGADLRYTAWGPARDVRDRHRTHYKLSEDIPQPRELLGVFHTAELARAACAQHRNPHLPE